MGFPHHRTGAFSAVSEKSVSLNAEAKTTRDASQALDGHDAAANERPLDR